jgi:hypothetical protein
MQTIHVEILNPQAEKILISLADLNLININPSSSLSELLAKLRNNADEVPSMEEIAAEVKEVRIVR